MFVFHEFMSSSGSVTSFHLRRQNSRVFFSKSVKKSVKCGVLEYAKLRTVLQSNFILTFVIFPLSVFLFIFLWKAYFDLFT